MRKQVLFACFAIAAITAIIYSPCLKFAFTRYDDIDYVIGNKHIKDGLTPSVVRWAFTDVGYASNWHPLTWISHALDVSLTKKFGLTYAPPEPSEKLWAAFDTGFAKLAHAHNLALHIANSVLLLLLMLMFVRRIPTLGHDLTCPVLCAALAISLFWAIHPLRAEVVCWVSERKELLSVFFLLLTLICYINGSVSRLCYVLSILAFMLALLAKPVAVSLPAVLVAMDWCLRRECLKKAIVRSLPHMALAAMTVVLTMLAQTEGLTSGKTIPPDLRIVCAITAPAKYLAQTVWPFGLTIDYPVPTWENWGWIVAGCGVLVMISAVCVLWLFKPGFWSGVGAFAIAWAYIGLIPMLGLVKVGIQPHSDRYTYWIGCGIAVVCFTLLVRSSPLWRSRAKGMGIIALSLLSVMAVSTLFCESVWRNTVTLYSNVVGKTHNVDMSYHLALELFAKNTDESADQAESMLREVLSCRHTAEAEGNLAFILAVKNHKDYERAGSEVEMFSDFALSANPKCYTALAAKAMYAHRTGRHRKALEYINKAMECGYDPQVVLIDLDEWRANADKEDKK